MAMPTAERDGLSTREEQRRAWGLEQPALGLSLGGPAPGGPGDTRRRWVDQAEALGLHSIWLPEMHFEHGVSPAPLVELAAWAPWTSRLRLGTTSLLLPLHPPEALAAEIASLDRLSNGRALIGLGRGFRRKMLEAFGVPPAEKRDRFDEALDRILALWSDGHAKGDVFAPRQCPHPPLAVAAFGPKGLAQAARRGLPYLASPVETLQQIEANQKLHRSGLPDPAQTTLSLVMRAVFVSEDRGVLDAIRERLAAEWPGRRAGLPAAIHAAVEAPLEERVVIGTSEEVTRRLVREQERLSIDLLIVRPQLAGIERGVLERSLSLLAERVWPAVEAAAQTTTRDGAGSRKESR